MITPINIPIIQQIKTKQAYIQTEISSNLFTFMYIFHIFAYK